MKVIHLPVNISSQISTRVRALRALGVDARGLARNFSPIQDHTGIETVDWFGTPNPVVRLWRGIRWRWKLLRAVAWADVVHWHWGDSTWKERDLRVASRLGKARLVEFWGDDLREPKRASQDNPFLARMYQQHPELANQRSQAVQDMFHRHGAAIAPLLENGARRNGLGVQSRKYIEANHDARKLTAELVEIYKHLSARQKTGQAPDSTAGSRFWRLTKPTKEHAEACVR